MDLNTIDKKLSQTLDYIDNSITSLSKKKDQDYIRSQLNKIKPKIKLAKRKFKKLEREVKALEEDKNSWNSKIKKHRSKIKKIDEKIKEINPEKILNDKKKSNVIAYGDKIQDETIESLAVTKNILNETDKTADAILVSLDSQTEQVKGLYDELYEIDDTIEKAKKITTRMLIKVASDKVLWILVALLIAVIIFIIVWKSTH